MGKRRKEKLERPYGRPWDIAAKFNDFEGASLYVKGASLNNVSEFDFKIKKMSSGQFLVKKRLKLVPVNDSRKSRKNEKV